MPTRQTRKGRVIAWPREQRRLPLLVLRVRDSPRRRLGKNKERHCGQSESLSRSCADRLGVAFVVEAAWARLKKMERLPGGGTQGNFSGPAMEQEAARAAAPPVFFFKRLCRSVQRGWGLTSSAGSCRYSPPLLLLLLVSISVGWALPVGSTEIPAPAPHVALAQLLPCRGQLRLRRSAAGRRASWPCMRLLQPVLNAPRRIDDCRLAATTSNMEGLFFNVNNGSARPRPPAPCCAR